MKSNRTVLELFLMDFKNRNSSLYEITAKYYKQLVKGNLFCLIEASS